MIPGARTIQMLMEGNPYYWSGLIIVLLFLDDIIWSERNEE